MRKRKIYVASSWRNPFQPMVVELLRSLGHEVYDFRNPTEGDSGFSWSSIDPNWKDWTTDQYKEALNHHLAEHGFKNDLTGMMWADTCVMVLPCGRSANTEAGWMKGMGKQVFVFQPMKQEPELMYKLYDDIIGSEEELIDLFKIEDLTKKIIERSEVERVPCENVHIDADGHSVKERQCEGYHSVMLLKPQDMSNGFSMMVNSCDVCEHKPSPEFGKKVLGHIIQGFNDYKKEGDEVKRKDTGLLTIQGSIQMEL